MTHYFRLFVVFHLFSPQVNLIGICWMLHIRRARRALRGGWEMNQLNRHLRPEDLKDGLFFIFFTLSRTWLSRQNPSQN